MVAARHGISQSSLSLWIKAYLGEKETAMAKTPSSPQLTFQQSPSVQEAELVRLKKELEQQKLRNLALEELIEVAEQRFKVEIRKKPGAKQ